MSLNRLIFTKDWTSSADFATRESSEMQVRTDIQLLHNETRDVLNQLIDALSSSTGASEIGVNVIAGIISTSVQGVLEELAANQGGQSTDIESLIESVTYDSETGVFTFTTHAGAEYTIDTALEKVVTNFDYNEATKKLILTTPEQTYEIDLADLIEENDFLDSSTIAWSVSGHRVSASLKSDYLSDIQQARDAAVAAATTATQSRDSAASSLENTLANAAAVRADTLSTNTWMNDAKNYSWVAEGYAAGTQNGAPVPASSRFHHNNAKYYAELAEQYARQTDGVKKVASIQSSLADWAAEGEVYVAYINNAAFLLEDAIIFVEPDPEVFEDYISLGIRAVEQTGSRLKFIAKELPEVAISVSVLVLRG